jgi:hypothetical protein
MKFWTTFRVEQITFELIQQPMLEIERRINEAIAGKDYGPEIESLDIVINIFNNPVEERFKYSPKNKETDVDVRIPREIFLEADKDGRCVLYLKAILHGIDGLRANKHLKKFDFDGLVKTLTPLFEKYNHSGIIKAGNNPVIK